VSDYQQADLAAGGSSRRWPFSEVRGIKLLMIAPWSIPVYEVSYCFIVRSTQHIELMKKARCVISR
jgi:hypothetical protein